jgi:hypothetical protein
MEACSAHSSARGVAGARRAGQTWAASALHASAWGQTPSCPSWPQAEPRLLLLQQQQVKAA